MSNTDDESDFLQEMADVNPLKQDKIPLKKPAAKEDLSIKNRQQAATQKTDKYVNFLTDGEIAYVEPEEVLCYKTSGLQPMVFKNLRNGKYPLDEHLDLHRHNLEQARQAVFHLISRIETEELRCLLITHGKGHRSRPAAKIKSYVNHWLMQVEPVLAFHSAIPKHGGTGSVYVLLKKAKHLKAINQKKYL